MTYDPNLPVDEQDVDEDVMVFDEIVMEFDSFEEEDMSGASDEPGYAPDR